MASLLVSAKEKKKRENAQVKKNGKDINAKKTPCKPRKR